MIDWSDPSTTPSLDHILANITLYWLTQSFSTGLFHYRLFSGLVATKTGKPGLPPPVKKPTGYSHFTHELIPVIIPWVEQSGLVDLVWSRRHEKVSVGSGSALSSWLEEAYGTGQVQDITFTYCVLRREHRLSQQIKDTMWLGSDLDQD
jgi:hypothetical protein